ncbi:MAG: insulinase family protein [Euryarchaeota archaeon]|nr:insulinase family protein [Euryarchaeota archaeon]
MVGLHAPPVQRRVLRNGLEVLLVPRPASPVVSVWVWYRVGSKNEAPGTTGAAHWLEHMLFKGSRRYRVGAMDRAIVEAGGVLNAFTDADFTAYFSTVPRDHASAPLDIEADRMTGATIPSEEIDKERSIVLSEREGNENYPIFRVEEEIYSLAFREHPYRWDALGSVQDIRGMHRDSLYGFYRKFYGPKNATLVVVGGFDPARMRREVERRFSSVHSTVADPTLNVVEPEQRGERRTTLKGPGSTPMVRIGWKAPAVSDPHAAALLMLDLYLGGENALYPTGGFRGAREHPTARLYQALVDRGLAVRAGSDWPPRVHPGLFSLFAQAAPGVRVERLEEVLLSESERLQRSLLTSAELRRLKERLLRGASLAWEGSTRTAFRLGFFRSLGSLAWDHRIFDAALKVRPSDLRDAARRLFRDGARCVVRYEVQDGARSGGAP